MGQKTGRPRGRPKGSRNGVKTLPTLLDGPTPGGKEAGEKGLAELAAYLEADLPYRTRAKLLVQLTSQSEGVEKGVPQSCLAALKYINDLCGLVTLAQQKEAESEESLPQIIFHGPPPPRPSSVEALKLLATAKGSQYDEAFPSSPPDPPEPPKPFQSVVTVRES